MIKKNFQPIGNKKFRAVYCSQCLHTYLAFSFRFLETQGVCIKFLTSDSSPICAIFDRILLGKLKLVRQSMLLLLIAKNGPGYYRMFYSSCKLSCTRPVHNTSGRAINIPPFLILIPVTGLTVHSIFTVDAVPKQNIRRLNVGRENIQGQNVCCTNIQGDKMSVEQNIHGQNDGSVGTKHSEGQNVHSKV
jgi:hypothetical protein